MLFFNSLIISNLESKSDKIIFYLYLTLFLNHHLKCIHFKKLVLS